jgi:trimeric autotransporter adhesin
MKKTIQYAALWLLLSTLNFQLSTIFAQGTAFTYQGKLYDGANRATGSYDLSFAVFSDSNGVNQVSGTLTNTATAINNGLFTVALDFGPGIFTGPPLWLQIGAETNGGGGVFTLLTPLQQLTPAPYAIYAANAGTAASANGVAAGVVTGADIASGQVVKSLNNLQDAVTLSPGANITITPSGNTLTIAASSSIQSGSSNAWSLTGNAGSSPSSGNFLGTTDNNPLELHVNNQRALRLEPDQSGQDVPNVIGGMSGNFVSGVGGTVAGGGTANYENENQFGATNSVIGSYGTVSGGAGNTAGYEATVGGGFFNNAGAVGGGQQGATVGGGLFNAAEDEEITIGGGAFNTANEGADYSTIGGGYNNTANAGAAYATIGGGENNTANGAGSFVGGGGFGNNPFEGNTASGTDSTVGGGTRNQASGSGAFVGGGGYDGSSFIGNTASGPASTVAGGLGNLANDAYATIGGGLENTNTGYGSTVGGGQVNTILNEANYATIAGGLNNICVNFGESIGGGQNNTNTGNYGTIPGGFANVARGQSSFAAGQSANANDNNSFVWSDGTRAATSQGADSFAVLATGGVFFYTTPSSLNVEVDSNADLDFGTTTRQMLNLYSTTYGIGVQNNDEYFRTGDQFYWYEGGAANNNNGNSGGGTTLMSLSTSGLSVNGTFVSASDRNLKEHFEAVDGRQVLAAVSALPISRWNYKADTTSQHIGPMAQDFYAAFGVGPDDKHITTIDEGGVALAAIQGLNEKVESGQQKAETEIEKLETENADLKQQLAATQKEMTTRLAALEKAVARVTDQSAATLAATSAER